eukprot:878970_1
MAQSTRPGPDDENAALSGIELNGFALSEGGNSTPITTVNYSRQGYRHVSQGSMQYHHPQPQYVYAPAPPSNTKLYCTAIYHVLHHLALIYCLLDDANPRNISSTTTAHPTPWDFTLEPTLSPSISSVHMVSTNQPSSTIRPSEIPTVQPVTNAPTPQPSEIPTVHPVTNAPSTSQPTIDHFVYENHIGDYKISSQNASHSNWLLCDGSFVDSKDYPKLFGVIRYSFGSFTGYPSLFALPDATDRVVGIQSDSNAMGYDTGRESVSLATSNIPAHYHYIINSGSCTGGYSAASRPYLSKDCNVGTGLLVNENFEYQHKATANAPNQFRSASVGSGSAFSIMQPTVFVGNLFIWA